MLRSLVGSEMCIRDSGDTDGVLHQYSTHADPHTYTLSRECSVSSKRVAQIECVPELKKLLVVCAGVIHLLALDSLQIMGQLTRLGDTTLAPASLIRVARHSGRVSVCVIVEKMVLVLECGGGDTFSVVHQLSIPERICSMVQLPYSLCLGSKRGYSMANLHSRQFDMLFETGSSKTPLIADADEELVLLRDCVGICVNSEGKPTRKTAIQWASMPRQMIFDTPHLLGLMESGVEVRSLDGRDSAPVQSIALRHACALARHPERSLVFAAAEHEVYGLVGVPVTEQVGQLLQLNHFDRAIRLSAYLDPKVASQEQRRIYGLYACDLFAKGDFKAAFRHFGLSDANPISVVAMVPDLLPPYVPQPPPPCNVLMPALVKSLHMQAMECAVGFLEGLRAEQLAGNSAEVASVLDTVLLKALLTLGREQQALELLGGKNHCHLEESARLLDKHGLEQGLVSLYTSNQMHARAIQILQAQPQQPPHSKVVGYLRKHCTAADTQLVFEVMTDIIKLEPETGLKVFTSARAGPDRIPTGQVLDWLKQHAPELRVQYLESVIRNEDIKESGAEYHNELALLYLASVTGHKDYDKTKDLPTRLAVAKEAGSIGRRRKKLILFLEHQPRCYQPDVLLDMFPANQLYQERAILLRAIGNHREALNIYVHRLNDDKLAERYCLCLYNLDSVKHADIYLELLRVYLQPPEDISPDLKAGLALMTAHISQMDPIEALALLPDKQLTVAKLEPFLSSALRSSVEKRRNIQVQRHLMYAEVLGLDGRLTRLQEQSVMVAPGMPCAVCTQPMVSGQAVAVGPNKSVMHPACHTTQPPAAAEDVH
eukprot:TRINITY_DN18398_c0_g1_i1.p1 TRINITY_DN18398_c0_g1~~TRINITY_DN18398_c0_g1_i1.p1  ORF type:complete len:873 (-),score=225.97 TRINITY_DN18398_c0_g1_i1:324-2804(-)